MWTLTLDEEVFQTQGAFFMAEWGSKDCVHETFPHTSAMLLLGTVGMGRL